MTSAVNCSMPLVNKYFVGTQICWRIARHTVLRCYASAVVCGPHLSRALPVHMLHRQPNHGHWLHNGCVPANIARVGSLFIHNIYDLTLCAAGDGPMGTQCRYRWDALSQCCHSQHNGSIVPHSLPISPTPSFSIYLTPTATSLSLPTSLHLICHSVYTSLSLFLHSSPHRYLPIFAYISLCDMSLSLYFPLSFSPLFSPPFSYCLPFHSASISFASMAWCNLFILYFTWYNNQRKLYPYDHTTLPLYCSRTQFDIFLE